MVYCNKCRYIDYIPVDGPRMQEPICKKVKEIKNIQTPFKNLVEAMNCDPYIDNRNNDCDYYEERQGFLNKIFTWGW